MSDITAATDAIVKTQTIILGAVKQEADGVAYQLVAQATAMAIQDSVEYLRAVNTVAATTIGVALELLVAGEQNIPKATAALAAAQAVVTAATANFAAVGAAAGTVLAAFPS